MSYSLIYLLSYFLICFLNSLLYSMISSLCHSMFYFSCIVSLYVLGGNFKKGHWNEVALCCFLCYISSSQIVPF